MVRPLTIVPDTPSPDPGLGFGNYADALAAAITGGKPPRFTVGIYGSWGRGKSSLLNAVDRLLQDEPSVLPVRFEAWRYERADHIVVPLLHSIYTQLPRGDEGLTTALRQALLSLVEALSVRFGPISISGASLVKAPERPYSIDQLDAAYVRPYADMTAIGKALGESKRIAILVDDLDRCSPAKIVSLLEAIKLVMDVPGFVFVLALDYDVLVRAVAEKYPHASGHVFIEKMIQVPFRVPQLDLKPETFLDDLIPDWDLRASVLPRDFVGVAYDVCRLGLSANPRQIKRFVNSILLVSRIAATSEIQLDSTLLCGVIGLQLKWPLEYSDLASQVTSDEARPSEGGGEATNATSPVDSLLNSEDLRLARYAERFFGALSSSAESLEVQRQLLQQLRAVIRLTNATAVPQEGPAALEGEPLPAPASELRVIHRAEIEEALRAAGFEARTRYPNVFRSPLYDGCRVKFGATMVWFQRRDRGGRWKNEESYLLTRGHQQAVELVNDSHRLAHIARGTYRPRKR